MLNISTIANLAQTLLPANSPWRGKIAQAAELAKQFSPNKDGIAKLMQTYGKRNSDLQDAVKMLDNPILKNTLGRVPGLNSMLQNAANNLANDPQFNAGAASPTAPQMNNNPGSSSPVNSSFQPTSISERLKRLP